MGRRRTDDRRRRGGPPRGASRRPGRGARPCRSSRSEGRPTSPSGSRRRRGGDGPVLRGARRHRPRGRGGRRGRRRRGCGGAGRRRRAAPASSTSHAWASRRRSSRRPGSPAIRRAPSRSAGARSRAVRTTRSMPMPIAAWWRRRVRSPSSQVPMVGRSLGPHRPRQASVDPTGPVVRPGGVGSRSTSPMGGAAGLGPASPPSARAWRPPSTWRISPVIARARSESRKQTASAVGPGSHRSQVSGAAAHAPDESVPPGDGRGRPRLEGAGGDEVGPDGVRSEVAGQVAVRALQSALADAHPVVGRPGPSASKSRPTRLAPSEGASWARRSARAT